ncbi:BON domain-containing protein [Roseateles sp. PN1]|uniref:BON domain-containing protein n=1 Tax=Roseateles sp. PN1 TaxID=3137372 RepID=UPI00313A1759
MKIPKNPSPQAMRALAAAIIALSMAACSKEADDARTPGKKLDDGIAKMEQQSEAMKAEVKQGAADAASASSTAMQDAKQATLEMREQVGADLSDAGIVTTVKAKLAAETLLTVSDINVDSTQGRVVLRGTAADQVAVARARAVALGVKGVVDVDNQLTVKTKS